MEYILIAILTIITVFSIGLGLVFGDKLKKGNHSVDATLSGSYKEYLKLTSASKAVLFTSIILCVLSGFYSGIKLYSDKMNHENDSITWANIINNQNNQISEDSIQKIDLNNQISALKSASDTIIRKQDSIKYAIIDIAAKEMEAARKVIEYEREMIFSNFQTEILTNLAKINSTFTENHLIGFEMSMFSNTKLSNTYINKLRQISRRKYLNINLDSWAEHIDKINNDMDRINSGIFKNKENRDFTIRQILKRTDILNLEFTTLNEVIKDFVSYKEFESLTMQLP